jgi:hypothetical protein
MKVALINTGKTEEKYIREGLAVYGSAWFITAALRIFV